MKGRIQFLQTDLPEFNYLELLSHLGVHKASKRSESHKRTDWIVPNGEGEVHSGSQLRDW